MLSSSPIPSRPPHHRSRMPGCLASLLLGAVVLGAGFSAYFTFVSVRDFVAGWNMTDLPMANLPIADQPITNPPTPNPVVISSVPATPLPLRVPATATPAPLLPKQWAGTERVTVLLMGIDYRAGATCEAQGTAFRTDSMMLATIDPVGMTAGLLSIPRDLWVTIPGYDENDTINTANFRGDAYAYPGGGPALAVKTVEYNLGVKVDFYVRMDFAAFEKIIDTLGGVDINNQEAINDPQYPDGACGFEPFYLSAGPHHLDGHDALRYARTRHNSSDITRGERQQEVALATLRHIQDPVQWPAFLAQAPSLYQALNDNVRTNLTLDQIIALALLVKNLPPEQIRHQVIDFKYVQLAQTANGRQVLQPWWDKIRGLRDSMFASAAFQPHATASNSGSASLSP
jgi:polyisoprenyl-teichoic acid--peptidoglycan teichoic acid transferase